MAVGTVARRFEFPEAVLSDPATHARLEASMEAADAALARFPGEAVALLGGDVIVHGKDMKEVHASARTRAGELAKDVLYVTPGVRY